MNGASIIRCDRAELPSLLSLSLSILALPFATLLILGQYLHCSCAGLCSLAKAPDPATLVTLFGFPSKLLGLRPAQLTARANASHTIPP